MTKFHYLPEALAALIERVRKVHGLDLSVFDMTFLNKALEKKAAESGTNALIYGERLSQDFTEAEAFLKSLHVVYSEFFRNTLAFALLEQLILPGILTTKEISGGGEIRIWSAGCATGQEAWSLAILLNVLIGIRAPLLSYRIIATDLSSSDLAVARKGYYTEEAVGNLRMAHLLKYFYRQNEGYCIESSLRDRVDFTVYDLLNMKTICPPESIYGNFDLVFCSNVLLYYRPKIQALILDKLHHCLAPGGYLVTDESEGSIVEGFGGFRRAAMPAAIFVKDGTSQSKYNEGSSHFIPAVDI